MAKEGFALDQDSYISQRGMGLAFVQRKEFEQATECLEKASSMSKRSTFSLADLIYLYMQRGMVDKAHEVRAELEKHMKESKYTSPFMMGYAYSNLGNFDEAFNWFEKAYENHDGFLFMMRNYPWLPDKLKTDERFISLMKRLKVPNF